MSAPERSGSLRQGAAPTDDPDETIGEALVLAAANGRVRVVDHLLAVGASVETRPYRNTTGLHLAVQFRKAEMVVGHPIARGASLHLVDDELGADAAGWAAACDDGSPDAATIVALVAGQPEAG